MNIGPIIRAMNHNRTRVVLIVLEIALTLAIVTNCVNVILSERAKMNVPSGFDDDNIVWLRVRPFAPEFQETGAIDTTVDSDLRIISAVPGVRAAANTSFQFWEGGGSSDSLRVAGSNAEGIATQMYFTTHDIVDTLGARVIQGRGFQPGDHGVGTEPDPLNVVLLTKTMADALFPDGQAVGKAVEDPPGEGGEQEPPMTVIGVIEHFYNPFGIPGAAADAVEDRAMFLPARVGCYGYGIRYLIRTEPEAMQSVIPEIEKRLAASSPGRVFEFLPMPEKKARWFSQNSILITTMTCIIIALVAVTALGLLGLTSLAVAERTRQIGTRRALGATRGDILRYFLIENWLVTTAGLILGVGGAYALNLLMVSNVSDVKLQWVIVAGGVVLLWINGMVATIPPALRASRLSPSIATRSV